MVESLISMFFYSTSELVCKYDLNLKLILVVLKKKIYSYIFAGSKFKNQYNCIFERNQLVENDNFKNFKTNTICKHIKGGIF